MSTYLQRNPPRVWQYGYTVSGRPVRSVPQVTLHTYEAGWPASQGALYISTRTNSAGYHWLTGLDQSIQLAPWGSGTAHAPSVNTFSKGVSCMWFAGRWGQLSAANRTKLINGMALGAHRYSRWCVSQGLGAVPARKITGAQAKNRQAGFVYHGDLQADRSDPGRDFPWNQFITEFRRLESGGSTPAASTPSIPTPKPGGLTVSDINKVLEAIEENKQEVWRAIREIRDVPKETWQYGDHQSGIYDFDASKSRISGETLSRVSTANARARSAARDSAATKAMVEALVEHWDGTKEELVAAVKDAAQEGAAAVSAADVAGQLRITVDDEQEG